MLSVEWMAALDSPTCLSFVEHARQHENTFKKSDQFIEDHIETDLIDKDENDRLVSLGNNTDSDGDESF